MTPERFRRLKHALIRRQPDLTLLLENVHKPHNLSAVVRTCDAVGVLRVHAVVPEGPLSLSPVCASGSERWVEVRQYRQTEEALTALNGDKIQLLAAHPGEGALDYRQVDFRRPTAILLGQEKDGLSRVALEAAEQRMAIPMEGLGASLNVSVAAALFLYEAQRQRRDAGLYESSRLSPETFSRLLFEWAYPEIADLCRRQRRPYPELGPDGEVLLSAGA
jgi:tRNA (guanosine-2'-O-)-methyltransferase